MVAVLGERAGRGSDVVVRQHDPVEWQLQRPATRPEVERAAVIAVREHDDAVTARGVARREERHDVGLAA